MPASTTQRGLPYPLLTDSRNVPRDIKALADRLELGYGGVVYVADSTARAALTPYEGMVIYYNTDNILQVWDGSAWKTPLELSTSAWTAPTLGSSWVNFGAPYQVAQYRKLGDMVQIRGIVKSGTLAAIFTLPAGFRPPTDVLASAYANGGSINWTISSAGVVTALNYSGGGTNASASLFMQFSTTA